MRSRSFTPALLTRSWNDGSVNARERWSWSLSAYFWHSASRPGGTLWPGQLDGQALGQPDGQVDGHAAGLGWWLGEALPPAAPKCSGPGSSPPLAARATPPRPSTAAETRPILRVSNFASEVLSMENLRGWGTGSRRAAWKAAK